MEGRMEGQRLEGRKEGGNAGGEEGRKFPTALSSPGWNFEARSSLCFLPACGWLLLPLPPTPHLCHEAPPHRSLWVTSVLSWVLMELLRSRKQGHRFAVVRTHRSGEKFSRLGNAANPEDCSNAPASMKPAPGTQGATSVPRASLPLIPTLYPSQQGSPFQLHLAITPRNWTRHSAPQRGAGDGWRPPLSRPTEEEGRTAIWSRARWSCPASTAYCSMSSYELLYLS